MKVQMYVIHDKAAQFYNKPFYQLNDQIALRSAVDLLSTPGTDVYNNPSDFTLFNIGEYDDETAHITLHPDMPVIARFHELSPNIRIVDSALHADLTEQQEAS